MGEGLVLAGGPDPDGAPLTVAPPHHFDADTAVEPLAERRWRAWVPEHWFVGRGPNGGFLAALATRAAEAATERPLRSLGLHFVAAPAVGMTDAWMPAAFVALGGFVAAPTLDLTIHLRRALPAAGMAPGDYVLGRFSSRLSVSGVCEEDGELRTPGGELIAQSRQLALVRGPRA